MEQSESGSTCIPKKQHLPQFGLPFLAGALLPDSAV
jgi:hypothetical protein